MTETEEKNGPVETPAEDIATWWTPDGFVKQKTPAAFLAACNSDQDDWEACLKNAGYKLFGGGGPRRPIQIKTYAHESDNHFRVEIWDVFDYLSQFFVSGDDHDMFYATWWVEFERSVAAVEQVDELKRISTALITFARMGHGRHLMDKYGNEIS